MNGLSKTSKKYRITNKQMISPSQCWPNIHSKLVTGQIYIFLIAFEMKGVDNNSILCHGCKKWIHKRCGGVKGSLRNASQSFVCRCCKADSPITDGLNTDLHLDIGNGVSLEKVDKFCYSWTAHPFGTDLNFPCHSQHNPTRSFLGVLSV